MKIKKYIAGALLTIAGLSFSGCQPEMDFYHSVNPSEDNYYNTQEHLVYAVNGAYNIMQRGGGWARVMPFILNNRSDEFLFTNGAAQGEPESAELSAYTVGADGGFMVLAYQDMYVFQYASNFALKKLEENQDNAFDLDNPTDKKLYDRLRGEAYFLRGLSRFYLCMLWGDQVIDRNSVPVSDDYMKAPAQPGEVYQNMIEDFKTAAELLPVRSEVFANSNDVGRATKGSALGFLAKVYMGRPLLDGTANAGSAEWALAKEALKTIIDSGEYNLVQNYRDNSSETNENNEESIFEVQFCQSQDTQGFNPAANSDQNDWIFTGQNTMRQLEMTTPNSTNHWWNSMPSLALYNEFERDNGGNIIDPRAYQGLWIPNGASWKAEDGTMWDYTKLFGGDYTVRQGKWFGARKYAYDGWMSDPGKSGINDRLLRYADILLMYAECCIETGDEATALIYINKVRDRANNQVPSTDSDAGLFYTTGRGNLPTAEQLLASAPTLGRVVSSRDGSVILPGTTINTVRRLLKHEYSAELYLDGWRFYNLMRWYNNPSDPDAVSILENLEKKYLVQIEQTELSGAIAFNYSKHRILPIPSKELNSNPNMKPNAAN
ncbi:MAG: RagB/SusD family nutrient uptake outer membrane protein [Dysgonomonas sp.]|nr:RagB/SusD family nutrient uptake outer membrane protein [Dysgonomonas sp.]